MPEGSAPTLDDLIGRKGIAKIAKVTLRTVRRWQQMGLLPLPDFRCGGISRWHEWKIRAWVLGGGTRDRRKKPPKSVGQMRTSTKREPDSG